MIGISNRYTIAADISLASDVAIGTVGLTSPVAANETQHIRAWIPITVGATGGVRVQVVVPAAGTSFIASIELVNTVAPSSTVATQAASAVFTNAAANAGTHWLEIVATIVNGATAGSIDIQLAQNTSDVLPLVVEAGGFMEVLKW